MAHGRPHPSFATADDGPKKRFSFKDLRGFGRMQKYLKPYMAHFAVGMVVMSTLDGKGVFPENLIWHTNE